ncbi:MAG TPA: ABC transporter ATP-binding protein [Acidimicrobiales bacterium]
MTDTATTTVLEGHALTKTYGEGAGEVRALVSVDVAIERGEFVAIGGPSGSGKSTLLHLLGGLDEPTTGTVVVDGVDLASLDPAGRAEIRRRRLGFVFQFFNLLPALSAWENVAVPRLLDGVPLKDTKAAAVALLDRVGLGGRGDHRPSELSGGQLQRVAVARALIADPVLILADEPTGNLDQASGAEVMALLRTEAADQRRTLVMVTHDDGIAGEADRVLHLVDGQLT